MTPAATWFVTPDAGGSYRVVLEDVGDGWSATVERDGGRWVFLLRPGPEDGRAWIGDRLFRYAWSDGRLSVNGVEHPLLVETEARHRVREVRGTGSRGRHAAEVRAPMPGLILAVEVEEGAHVEAGDGVVVIEAMKMENEIAAPASGIVRSVAVAVGDAVERNAIVCRIEPAGGSQA